MSKSITIVLSERFITALEAFVANPSGSTYSDLADTWKVMRPGWGQDKRGKWILTTGKRTANATLPILMCQARAVPAHGTCSGCNLFSEGKGCTIYSLRHQSNTGKRILAAMEIKAALQVIDYSTADEEFVAKCTGEDRLRARMKKEAEHE